MTNLSVTLPFKVPDLFAGFAEGNGLAKATPNELALEFIIKDNVLNLFKSSIKEIRIPQSEIEGIRFKQGWFGDRLYIRMRSIKWLANLPGRNNGELTLRVARRDRSQAVDFVRVLGRVGA